ncbi:hypothetical protein SY88_20890 [Clostridiales bacterium PH28_bin88]|nr:hypothetical protein SY88_20890 [Clostridiales bacterium PH28_bin88]
MRNISVHNLGYKLGAYVAVKTHPDRGKKSLLMDQAASVLWSPDGRYLAVGKWPSWVEVVSPDGEKVLFLKEYDGPAAWSPDGKYLQLEGGVYGEEEKKRILEVDTGSFLPPGVVPLGWDNRGLAYFLSE